MTINGNWTRSNRQILSRTGQGRNERATMSIHDKRNLECHVGDTAQTPMYPAPNTYSGDMLIY